MNGVQTCALPISRTPPHPTPPHRTRARVRWGGVGWGGVRVGSHPHPTPSPPLEGVGGRGYDNHTSVHWHPTRQDRHPGDGKRTPGRHPRGPRGVPEGVENTPNPKKPDFSVLNWGFFMNFHDFWSPGPLGVWRAPVGPRRGLEGDPRRRRLRAVRPVLGLGDVIR